MLLLLLLLLSTATLETQAAGTVTGPSSICSCTPRSTDASSSSYINELNSYTASMRALISDIAAQLNSLGLTFANFPAASLASIMQAASSANQATTTVNQLLQAINSNASTASTTAAPTAAAVTPAGCSSSSTTSFYGINSDSIFGSGGNYIKVGSQWQLALSNAVLIFDFGVNGCSNTTQYVEQICINGNPSDVTIFVQPNAGSGAQLLTASLATSTQSGQLCISVRQQLLAFSIQPRALKQANVGNALYLFSLSVTGCFRQISSACLTQSSTSTAAPCTTGNAVAELGILPSEFFYFARPDRVYGLVIGATNGVANGLLVVDVTAGGCRQNPLITRICSAGNFRQMRLGRLLSAEGNIAELKGSEGVNSTTNYNRLCYDVNETMALFALQPADLIRPADGEFRIFPEIYGCFQNLASQCAIKHNCSGPHAITDDSTALPKRALTPINMQFVSDQWVAAASGAQLLIDITVDGCRFPAPVRSVCIVETNATSFKLEAEFANAEFNDSATLNLTSLPSCVPYQELLRVRTLRLTLFGPSSASLTAKLTIDGCFDISDSVVACGRNASFLPISPTTTTAAPAVTTARPAESCQSQTLNSTSSSIPLVTISGGTYSSATGLWTVPLSQSLTLDLTANGCRTSAQLSQVCLLSNAETIRLDYVNEDNSRISRTGTQAAAGVSQCFNYAAVRAKSLIVQPLSLKAASSGDTAYTLQVNITGCYSAILSSCYDPVCPCSLGYRPLFNSKRYFNIQLSITAGSYSTYTPALSSSISAEYRNWLDMSDNMVGNNFQEFSDDYEGMDQLTFSSGSVALSGRLIMRNDSYTAEQLDAALTNGLTANTASGSFVVNAASIIITDASTTTTTTATPNATTTTTAATTTTTAAAAAALNNNTALLLGLLIPLILLLLLLLILLILLCKYCYCCCFSRRNQMQDQETCTQATDAGNEPKSAREERYYSEDKVAAAAAAAAPVGSKKRRKFGQKSEEASDSTRRRKGEGEADGSGSDTQTAGRERGKSRGKTKGEEGLRMPDYPLGEGEGEGKGRELSAKRRSATRADDEGSDSDGGQHWATRLRQPNGESADNVEQQMKFDRRFGAARPNTPRTHSIETVTYQIPNRQMAWTDPSPSSADAAQGGHA